MHSPSQSTLAASGGSGQKHADVQGSHLIQELDRLVHRGIGTQHKRRIFNGCWFSRNQQGQPIQRLTDDVDQTV